MSTQVQAKTILVTGGAGYIGSHTVLELLRQDYSVVVVDDLRNSSYQSLVRVQKLASKSVTFYKLDVSDYAGMESVLKKHSIDAIIHFAGLKSVGESVQKPVEYYDVNLNTTLVLLKLMSKFNINNLIFSSSATVYGKPEQVPIPETASLSTTNPYGSSKLFNEYILKDVAKANPKFKVVLLRYFNPVGADASGLIGEVPNGIPNNLMPYLTLVAGGKLPQLSVFGNDYSTRDGTGVRDYCHVTDLALGHIKALKKFTASTSTDKDGNVFIYNLGTGTGYSVLEMIEAMAKVSKVKINYKITGRRPGDVAEVVAQPNKAEKELGWKAQYGLEKMCQDNWNWQLKNPNGFNDKAKL